MAFKEIEMNGEEKPRRQGGGEAMRVKPGSGSM